MSLGLNPNTEYFGQVARIVNATVLSVARNIELLDNLETPGSLLVGNGKDPEYLDVPTNPPDEVATNKVLTVDKNESLGVKWALPPTPVPNTNVVSSDPSITLTEEDSDRLIYYERNAGTIILPEAPANGTNYTINCIGTVNPKSADAATTVPFASNPSLIGVFYDENGGPSGAGALQLILLTPFQFIIDGITITNADVGKAFLIKDQTIQTENGLYELNSITGTTAVLNRALNFDQYPEAVQGDVISVRAGTVNNNTNFELLSPDPVIIGGPVSTTPTIPSGNMTFIAATPPLEEVTHTVRLINSQLLSENTSIATILYNETGGTAGTGQFTGTLVNSNALVIDGVTLTSDDNGSRVLVVQQDLSYTNGIYTTTVSGSNFTLNRATDYDEDGDITLGDIIMATSGTTYSQTAQKLNSYINIPPGTPNTGPIIVGSTDLFYIDPTILGISFVTHNAELATTLNMQNNTSLITNTFTYNAVGGTAGTGQIKALLTVSDSFTVDSVTLTSLDNGTRVLLKNQLVKYENGIYTATISGINLTLDRAVDFNETGDAYIGNIVKITSGTVNAGDGFKLSTATTNPVEIGGVDIPFRIANAIIFDTITPVTTPSHTVELASTSDLDVGIEFNGSISYNNTGGASSRGQITATLTISDTFTIDGVTLSAADDGTRILLKDQASADQNGIWTTTILGTAFTLDRATDYDADGEAVTGDNILVSSGDTNYSLIYTLTNSTTTITLGGASGSDLIYENIHLIKTDIKPSGGDVIRAINSTYSSSLWATKDVRFDIVYDSAAAEWIVFPMNGPLIGQ